MQLRMAGTSKYCKGKKNSVYSVTENLYYEGQQFNENINGRITIQKFLLMGFFVIIHINYTDKSSQQWCDGKSNKSKGQFYDGQIA